MDIKDTMETFDPNNVIGGAINQASTFIIIKIKEILREKNLDLTPEEFAILIRLWGEDGITQSKLTEKTLKDKTNVSKLIERLTKKSLIKRTTSKTDQRNNIVYLTDKGTSLRNVVLPDILRLNEAMSKNIPAIDLEITVRTLKEISKNLKEI